MKYIFIFIIFLLFNIISVNTAFQTSIFSELNLDNEGKNVIVSPLSIYQVLGLTTNGAVDKTQIQMLTALEEASLDDVNNVNLKLMRTIKEFVTVELANGVMSTFEPIKSFVKICDKYEAPIEQLISKVQVNDWCSKKTHGKITEIIDELNPSTVMLLLNAVYFRGEWVYPFNPERTYKGTFYNLGKEEKGVEMMTQTHEFMYYQDSDIQAIELPYKNDWMRAILLFPTKKGDLNTYINQYNINDEYINKILDGMVETPIKLDMPKYEVEFYSKLKDVLKRLGMVIPFESDADFSGINESGGLYIDNVIHKTYLKVDEIGSEAAGVTVVDMRKGFLIPKVEI